MAGFYPPYREAGEWKIKREPRTEGRRTAKLRARGTDRKGEVHGGSSRRIGRCKRKEAGDESREQSARLEVLLFWRAAVVCGKGRVDGRGARVESEGEDVTPTAVAKEVIGLRPCARYPNRAPRVSRGRRREPTRRRRGRRRRAVSADEDGDDWRRRADATPLPRAPPIRVGVNPRPPAYPLLYHPAPREGARRGPSGGARATDPFRNSSVVLRYNGETRRRWPFFAPFFQARKGGERVFARRPTSRGRI